MAEGRALPEDGTWRAGCFRQASAGASRRIGVRGANLDGGGGRGDDGESAGAVDDPGSRDEQMGVHQRGPAVAAYVEDSRVRGRRHRYRRSDSDPGDGSRTQRGEVDPRMADHRRVGAEAGGTSEVT